MDKGGSRCSAACEMARNDGISLLRFCSVFDESVRLLILGGTISGVRLKKKVKLCKCFVV